MKNQKVKYLTLTAVLLALLIVFQAITQPLGQIVTGSLVNLILLVAVLTVGIWSGLTIAVISPVLAFLLGIGPALPQLVPFIAVGNAVIVTIAYLISKIHMGQANKKSILMSSMGLTIASIAKFLFLWVGIVIIALPLMPSVPEKQVAMLSAAFSWTQLITALIGSALSMLLVPVLKKAIK